MPPSDWPVGKSVIDVKGPSPLGGEGSAALGQMVLACRRGQTMESKPVTSIPPWFLLPFLPSGSCLEFLPQRPLVMDCDLEVVKLSKSFLPQVSFGQFCFVFHCNKKSN